MVSPSSIKAIGPPEAASGPTCPITSPTDPPEKRPSVISAITIPLSRHKVVILDVESSISGIPGPPTGPSYRTTTISLSLKESGLFSRASNNFCSPSKVFAFP